MVNLVTAPVARPRTPAGVAPAALPVGSLLKAVHNATPTPSMTALAAVHAMHAVHAMQPLAATRTQR